MGSPGALPPSQPAFQAESGEIRLSLKDWSAQDFANFYVRFRPHVVSYAKKFLSDKGRAEEVAQDAFLYLMTALPELDSELGVLRFLKWKARLLCFDYLSSPSSQLTFEYSEETMASEAGVVIEPHEVIERAQEAAIISLALARLPYRQRDALLATAYMGKTIAQASTDMEMSENAFRQLLYRARKAFKFALIGESEIRGLSATQILTIASKRAAKLSASLSIVGLVSLGAIQGLSLFEPEAATNQTFATGQINFTEELRGTPRFLDLSQSDEIPEASQAKSPSLSRINTSDDYSAELRPQTAGEGSESFIPVDSVVDFETIDQGSVDDILGAAESAFELGSSATATKVDLSGDIARVTILPGVTAHFGFSFETESLIQYLSLEVETESGTLVGVPAVFMEGREEFGGLTYLDFVASDFVFGDLTGNFDFRSASLHARVKHSFTMKLEIDPTSNSVRVEAISLNLPERP